MRLSGRRIQKKRIQTSVADKMICAGTALFFLMIIFAIFVPLLSPYSYSEQDVSAINLFPGVSHPFGTDKFGRDLFVRVWYGIRISLLIGIGSMIISGVTGTVIGIFSGYKGNYVDLICMRAADIMDAVPSMLYIILINLTFGANVGSILFGISISGWISTARIVRGEVLKLKNQSFLHAAQLSGVGKIQIFRTHLLPNMWKTLLVNLTFFIPKAIFTESFLSFLGIGISAPEASLGTLIQDARSQIQLYPYQMLYPAGVLCLLILAVNLIGYGLERKNEFT